MKKINIRKTYYHISRTYFTLNNLVIAVAFVIAASWAWGSVGVLQRNYALQREIDAKERAVQVAQLEALTLEYEQKYYQTQEYQELEVRERLGLAFPGESVVILPPNSQQATNSEQTIADQTAAIVEVSNFQQWIRFLFGGNSQQLQN